MTDFQDVCLKLVSPTVPRHGELVSQWNLVERPSDLAKPIHSLLPVTKIETIILR